MTGPLVLTVAEAADLLRLHKAAVYKMIRQGTFPVPVVKFGTQLRISAKALHAYLDGQAGAA